MKMFSIGSLRGRRGVVGTAVAAAAAAAIGLAAPAMAAPGAGPAAASAAVPWSKVGPGWSLALYSASTGGEGIKARHGSETLYLVNPAGGRYHLFTWAASSSRSDWQLQAWSGDVRRALFTGESVYGKPTRVYQLQLRTGAVSSFTLPARVELIGYTRPDGLNVLTQDGMVASLSSKVSLQRYNLAGKLQKTLARITYLSGAVYQPAGGVLAAGTLHGVDVVSNSGGVVRSISVPGVKLGCSVARWWSTTTILASCAVPNEAGPRLWLVPANGGRPTAMTPVRKGPFDVGDFNAWQLSSGLYVDGYGACGSLVIGRQPAHGPEQQVNVPGAASSLIVNATRSQLEVERINGCSPGISLVWFNPATRALKVAIGDGHNQFGVVNVQPYYIAGKY
jgi:hypothetical protein